MYNLEKKTPFWLLPVLISPRHFTDFGSTFGPAMVSRSCLDFFLELKRALVIGLTGLIT